MTKQGCLLYIALLFAILTLTGCVERKLTINTSPQDAVVILNDEEVGRSPVTVTFNWYGDYNVRIEKPGYETLNTHKNLEAPRHDKFPYDFFAQILNPKRIVDEYEWSFSLTQEKIKSREQLIESAKQLKNKASQN